MIKFRSKFQFGILLQFYSTAEKVTTIKLMMVMIRFPPTFQPFTIWLLSCFFLIEILNTEYKVLYPIKSSPKRI